MLLFSSGAVCMVMLLTLSGSREQHRGGPDGLCVGLQSDVWACFDEASLFGREFYTLGGSRGPSLAYYVPSLSALHLLLPHRQERAHAQPASLYRLSDAAAQQVRAGCQYCTAVSAACPHTC